MFEIGSFNTFFFSCFVELINPVKLQRQRMVNTRSATRSSDRNEVITNVPAIISTSASPTDTVPLNPLANLVAPLATKRHSRILQKSSGGEQLSLEIDAVKSALSPCLNQQQQQLSNTRSDGLAYCTKCGGLTTVDKCILTKKRYFSLDKERNERTMNFLQCFSTMNRGETPKSGSDNLLSASRKQCSFDGGTSEKSFGRLSNSNNHNSNSNSKTKPSSDCGASSGGVGGGGGITNTTSSNSNQITKNATNSSAKKSHTHRECTTSCSNRSLKDKSDKSSQNSLRETRTTASRKNSVFYFGSVDRDASSTKSKRVSQQYSRKASTRGPINLHEEQDSETREILLAGTTSLSKFDKFPHEIKIPEPVEAVR